ncbi:C4-dicarboxylate ABC transporter substrate-binding protein [Vibrio mimicus]|nr:C4-dicarboxylate ABC transporter substrate-binding protein [Vibrio mimicus]
MILSLYHSFRRIKQHFSGRKTRSHVNALSHITNEGREIHVIT